MKEKIQTRWEREYLEDYLLFIKEIFSGNPDFIVPVARKSCKLLNSLASNISAEINTKVFYLEFFDFQYIDLSNKKIAIIDDASHNATTIKNYRKEFIDRGCTDENIKTYAFVGHEDLLTPSNKFDKDIIIFKNRYLPERKYQSYLSIQSNHLLLKNYQSDIDHLVIQTQINKFTIDNLKNLLIAIEELGFVYELNPIKGFYRFGLQFHSKPDANFIADYLGIDIKNDFIFKVKFVYEEEKERLTCIPIYFPKVSFVGTSFADFCNRKFPIKLPIQYSNSVATEEKRQSKRMYWNICLLCNVIVARHFYSILKNRKDDVFQVFSTFEIRDNDLSRYLGIDVSNQIVKEVRDYILSANAPLDKAFENMAFNESLFPKEYNSQINSQAILSFLRKGYEVEQKKYFNLIAQKEDLRKPEFDATVDELIKVGNNTHPILFSVFLDELCDFGIVVPRTKYIELEQCWSRVYRSGENQPDVNSWERTKAIVSLALFKLGEKQNRILVEKILANFTYDFPPFIDRSIKNFKDNHCIYTEPYLFGPVNKTVHFELFPLFNDRSIAFQFFSRRHLENKPDKHGNCVFSNTEFERYKDIVELIQYNSNDTPPQENNESPYLESEYNSILFSLRHENFDKEKIKSVVNANFLMNYFELFKVIYERSGNVKHILALSIGRDIDLFRVYISYNINYLLFLTQRFIDSLKEKETNTETFVNQFGLHLASIKQKLDSLNCLIEAWHWGKEIVETYPGDPFKFDDVWSKIIGKSNFEDKIRISKEVIVYADNFNTFIPVFTFIETIIKLKSGKQAKDAMESNKFMELGFTNDFFSDEGTIMLNMDLAEKLKKLLVSTQVQLTPYINSYVKPNPTRVVRTHDLSKFFLNLDIYKNKTEFLNAFEEAGRHLTSVFGAYDYTLYGYEVNDSLRHKDFKFNNSFDEEILIRINSDTNTVLKARKLN